MTETIYLKVTIDYDETAGGEFDDSACFLLERDLSEYTGVSKVSAEIVKPPRTKTKTVRRSSRTGKFVTKEIADQLPAETQEERV